MTDCIYLDWYPDEARRIIQCVEDGEPLEQVRKASDHSRRTFNRVVKALKAEGYLETNVGRTNQAEVLPDGRQWVKPA